jgi:parallel beta-helix repeat protein
VRNGAIATITDNTISANECDIPSCGPDILTQDLAVGIYAGILGGTGTVISNNTLFSNDAGIVNYYTTGTMISGNTLTGNRFEGILLTQGDATVTNNTVTGGNIGVQAVSFAGDTANAQGTLTDNTITGAGNGIQLLDETTADVFIPTVTANFNNIAGNNTFGVNNTTTTSVDATCNWWGDPSGPSGAGPGSGDAVSTNVAFNPWLTEPADEGNGECGAFENDQEND